MKKPYLYLSGLKSLAKTLKGTERVHIGIRPYGFHAGNALSLFAYPYLLCEEMQRLGRRPQFKFFISINDYEQDELDGPDYRRYPFNIYPKNTSLQYTPDEAGCCENITEHWQPIIQKIVGSLRNTYPGIKIQFIKNSSLKNKSHFKRLLLDTLKNPRKQAAIFAKYSDKELLNDPIQYAGVICPRCKKSHGTTTVKSSKKIKWDCVTCGYKAEKPYEYYNYWWYHKAMLTARLRILGIRVAMSGADHYNEGDYRVRRAFLRKYFKDYPEPVMIFCPVLIAFDGQKMSKSRHNMEFAKPKELLNLASTSKAASLYLSKKMIANVKNEREYVSLFE